MASATMTIGPCNTLGYGCNLPIPFVKGAPVDYQTMTSDQLRKFIHFMYKRGYKRDLPISGSTRTKGGVEIQKPSWWPENVSFIKHLKITGGRTKEHHKLLLKMVEDCYTHHRQSALLSLGSELAEVRTDITYMLINDTTIRLVNGMDQTLAYVDNSCRFYDRAPLGVSSFVPSTQEQFSDKKVSVAKKKVNPKKKTSAKGKSNGPLSKKRKLFDHNEIVPSPSHPCQFCQKMFTYLEFCEEHEKGCPKAPPPTRLTQENFMSALGMMIASGDKTEPVPTQAKPAKRTVVHVGRKLRKLPARSQLLSIIKSNPLPLSSSSGKSLIAELGDKVEHVYPPPYHRDLRHKPPKRPIVIPENKYKDVAKKAILKHGENPHIYSYGKRQRTVRYQELVVGVSQHCFKTLNLCGNAQVCLTRLHPKTKLTVTQELAKKTHLERAFQAAITLPHISLTDIVKFPTQVPEKFRSALPPPPPAAKAKKVTRKRLR